MVPGIFSCLFIVINAEAERNDEATIGLVMSLVRLDFI